MKFNKILMIAAVLALAALPARAQMGVSVFDETRSLEIGTPGVLPLTLGGETTGLFTNGPVDTATLYGRGVIVIDVGTNGATATISAQPYTSADTTNWFPCTNFAAITATTSVTYTNFYYGMTTNGTGGIAVANAWLWPFTLYSAVPSVNLFNTPYPVYQPFTNAAAVALKMGGKTELGIPLNSGPGGRYLELVGTATGGATNGTCYFSAQLIAIPKSLGF